MTGDNNVYLRMPLDRVRSDALTGVRLAREAWRELDPKGAAVLGPTLEPGHEAEFRRQSPGTTGEPPRGSKTRRIRR